MNYFFIEYENDFIYFNLNSFIFLKTFQFNKTEKNIIINGFIFKFFIFILQSFFTFKSSLPDNRK